MESNANFKIVVVYDTVINALQAREMSGRLAAELQLDGEIDCDFWKFELLGHAEFRTQAAMEAADAGMVIIAAGVSALPSHVKSWIESWPHRQEDLSALVALLDVEGEPTSDAPPVSDYLRRIAGERGMDFFCKAGKWWQFDLESLKQTRHFQSKSFILSPQPAHREYLGSHWGIND